MKANKRRLFFAIPLNEKYTYLIRKYIQSYSELNQLRWIKEENLHITMLFMGNVNAEYIPALIKTAEGVFTTAPKFELIPEHIIIKPSPKIPVMIWLKFKEDYLFSSIHTQLKGVMNAFVETPETRKLIPHITLARIKNKIPVLINPIEVPKLIVDKIELWESITDSRGAIYVNLKTFSLKG